MEHRLDIHEDKTGDLEVEKAQKQVDYLKKTFLSMRKHLITMIEKMYNEQK